MGPAPQYYQAQQSETEEYQRRGLQMQQQQEEQQRLGLQVQQQQNEQQQGLQVRQRQHQQQDFFDEGVEDQWDDVDFDLYLFNNQ